MPVDANTDGLDAWSARYIAEGHIWGDEPSQTARAVIDNVGPTARVLEIGFGYGRDLRALVAEGHTVHGVEKALIGLNEATRLLSKALEDGNAFFTLGSFRKAPLAQRFYDAVFSHRMLHLVKPEDVQAHVTRMGGVLRPDGLLVIGARDPDDFNPEQMDMIGSGQAVYKDRPTHIISFWDEEKFRKFFSRCFNILSFQRGTEMESQRNPVPSHFTIMVAKKKTPEQMDHEAATGAALTNGHALEPHPAPVQA